MKNTLQTTAMLAAGLLAVGGQNAQADFNSGDYLTGGWEGNREAMISKGVTPFAYYDSIASTNLSGGIQNDEDFAGQIYAGVDLDLEKLMGWRRTTAKISFVNRHGSSLADSIGGIYDPMTIYGGQVNYLYQAFIETQVSDQLSFKFGRVSADTDFAKSDLYGYSLSTAINGPIRATLLESSITSFPYSVWGARAKYKLNDEHQIQVGVYQTGANQWDYTQNGLDFSFRSDDGISVLAQYDWTPNDNTRVFAGLISSFRDFDQFGGGVSDSLHRVYLHGETEIAKDLKAFGMITYTSQDAVAKTPLQISAGLNYKGMIAERKDDVTFFFATYGQLSDEYATAVGQDLSSEMVFELGHRFQVSNSVYLQPSVQYINNPGGSGDIDDAVVLGVWAGFKF